MRAKKVVHKYPSRKTLINHAIEGNRLSDKDASVLEASLKYSPNDIEIRTKLLGFYFTRYIFSKKYRSNRKQHIIWMIDCMPEHLFTGEPFCIVLKSCEPRSYQVIKKLWMKQIKSNPGSVKILTNAGAALLLSDFEQSKAIVLMAKKISPHDSRVRRMVSRIRSLEHGRI